MYLKKYKAGFTLVELSIVIVIIGLIVAGVVGGQRLIKNAKVLSQVSDLKKYDVAFNAFVLQYDNVPGDLRAASSYWAAFLTKYR
jgi:prepilin-type N-terminal cleavage/methylation domain-containing protein